MTIQTQSLEDEWSWCEVIHDCDKCPGLDTYGYGDFVPQIVAKHVVTYGCESIRYTRRVQVIVKPFANPSE